MKSYVLTEEDIKELLRPHWHGSRTLREYCSNFLKSKQPVEEIATTTCPKNDCVFYSIVAKCSKSHKSCCRLLYISDDYIQKEAE